LAHGSARISRGVAVIVDLRTLGCGPMPITEGRFARGRSGESSSD
jgi:hypothetical protein